MNVDLVTENYLHLAREIFFQAIKDCESDSWIVRESAIAWLKESGWEWADTCDIPIRASLYKMMIQRMEMTIQMWAEREEGNGRSDLPQMRKHPGKDRSKWRANRGRFASAVGCDRMPEV